MAETEFERWMDDYVANHLDVEWTIDGPRGARGDWQPLTDAQPLLPGRDYRLALWTRNIGAGARVRDVQLRVIPREILLYADDQYSAPAPHADSVLHEGPLSGPGEPPPHTTAPLHVFFRVRVEIDAEDGRRLFATRVSAEIVPLGQASREWSREVEAPPAEERVAG